MKNILFPTDFSKAARHAFVYALKMAEMLEARITTLYAYQLPWLEMEAPMGQETLQKIFESVELSEFENYKDVIPALRQIAKEEGLDQIPIQHVLELGSPIQTILTVAERDKADLIIMGTKGAGLLKEIFLGSVAGEIMENAPCPVLAVPQQATFDGVIDKIAVAVSFKGGEKELIDKTIEFASLFDAAIECVYLDLAHTEHFTKRMQQLEQSYKHIPNIRFTVVEGTDLLKDLSNYLQKRQFDILVMGTHKRGFWKELFDYSLTKQFSYRTSLPILAMHQD